MDQEGPRASADPLDTPPPVFSSSEAASAAERLFGLEGSAVPLDSERDQNFCIRFRSGEAALLKISNPADDPGSLGMQTDAMLHIARHDPELPVMKPLPAIRGGYMTEVEDAVGAKHFVRAFTFLEGKIVRADALGDDALHDYGATVARVGRALRGFFHPAGGYDILWDLKHTARLHRLVEFVPAERDRALARRVLDRFDQRVSPSLTGLRAQIIHNDLTLDNVLLDSDLRASGIVDFGDLTHTALICDLAIALVSLMWGRRDPLDAAGPAITGFSSVTPLEGAESELLGELICARLVALVLIAAWRVRRYPANAAYITANVDLAWDLLRELDDVGLEEVNIRLQRTLLSGLPAARGGSFSDLLERRRRILGPALAPLSYEHPLYLVRGSGSRMFDDDGRAYLDAYNNVPVVGHSHPRVARAVAEQTATLNTNTRYLHHSVIELAERLVATMPDELDTVMFTNSGSEANDIAWRLATAYTGGTCAMVTRRAYHGVTTATIALSPEGWVEGEPAPHVATVPAPDPYRGPYRASDTDWVERYVGDVEHALSAIEAGGRRMAATFVDPVFTSDGIFWPPGTYLQGVEKAVRGHGSLLVADEVQCGFGRTGSHLWGFAASGITPDLVTLGKPMGNGYPVAAVVTRNEIAAQFAERTDLFSTFAGGPVASRAALAVLDVVAEEGLLERAENMGARLRLRLQELKTRHPCIGDVRGVGLLQGVELIRDRDTLTPDPSRTRKVVNGMRERGVLIGSTGPHDNVLKIRPPLVISSNDVDLVAATLDETLAASSR